MSDNKYRAKIDRLISERSGEVVLNGSHAHAAIILERMFAHADSSVKILTKRLDPRVYCTPETVGAAKRFIGVPDRKIQILVEDAESTKTAEFAKLLDSNNFSMRILPDHLHKSVEVNFALMDASGFRLESDDTGATAIVAFGEKHLTPRLQPLFDKLWELSEELTVAAA